MIDFDGNCGILLEESSASLTHTHNSELESHWSQESRSWQDNYNYNK